jgi:hypothetical protein
MKSSKAATNGNKDEIDAACPTPGNDAFTGATNIPIGTTLTNQSTCGATLQTNEALDCDSNESYNASVWYSFTATGSGPYYVTINAGTSLCLYSANIWQVTSLPTYGTTCNNQSLQCQLDHNNVTAGPAEYSMEVSNASPGTTYYIQVLYLNSGGGFCGSGSTGSKQFFSIGVATSVPVGSTLTNPAPNNTCATAYSACYLDRYNPSSASVDSFCTEHLPNPSPLEQNDVYTICYSFTTDNSSANQVGVQAYVYSHCLPNVFWADWKLYNSGCVAVACGNANNFTVSGVGCNTQYTMCFTFEAKCEIDTVTPYASWPSASPSPCTALPIKLLSFNASYNETGNTVDINWATASEVNNKQFIVEKSVDGETWQVVNIQQGSGNSEATRFYTCTDESPFAGLSYYRLRQVDYDGNMSYSRIVPINIPAKYSVNLFPNPTSGNMTLRYITQSPDPLTVIITDLSGKVVADYTISQVEEGINNFEVATAGLAPGMYLIQIINPQKTFFQKFIKE